MDSLCVLLTNNTLAGRAGSELYVRDVALALKKRGHHPVAYSTVLGEVAQDIRDANIEVVDDLAALSCVPDVIHGHHHLETITALLHFPKIPAIGRQKLFDRITLLEGEKESLLNSHSWRITRPLRQIMYWLNQVPK